MQIEAGKYYRTRDGRKVGPVKLAPDNGNHGPFEVVLEGDVPWFYDADGRLSNLTFRENPADLVAEWTDGPVRTETVTTRRIVPGVYGHLTVLGAGSIGVDIKVADGLWSATELDDLAMVASQLAEALRDA